MPAKIDLTGKVFHRLTVKKEAGRDRYGLAMWECECSCGATVVVRGRDLRTGNSKSCGCLNLEKATKKIQKQTVDHSNPASLASKKLSKKNTSGVRGVCPTKRGTWRATVGYKAGLYDLAKKKSVSIADEDMQIEFLLWELENNYQSVLKVLKSTASIREASDIVLKKFEVPANTGETVCASRAARGQKFYNSYVKNQKEDGNMSVKSIIESAISWMEKIAKDNTHGYDQTYRWGEKGDYDCSTAVITAFQQAGVPVKTKGATYTGNMLNVFKMCGFTDITSSVNRSTGAGLQRGDVLLNKGHHAAMYCGNGQEVEASINEKGTATGGKPGDQTGREFLIRSYRNYPWTNILRYTGGETVAVGTIDTGKGYLSMGDIGSAVKTMQTMLIACGYSCGSAGADGDFGSGTNSGLRAFQKANGLTVDGKYGPKSKAKLEELYNKKTGGSAKKSVDELAQEVIAGKWGSGNARKTALKNAGYDYAAVQKRVNEILSGTSSKKSVIEIAKEVIAGKWGNGEERKKKLRAAGYDPSEVQKEVNVLMK